MELSKKDTKMIQGLSVMAMVCLHLFCRTDYEGLFQPIVFIKGIPLSYYFGQLSDFCVFGFAFCSGYAHMNLFNQNGYYKRRLKSLSPLMLNYWIIIIIFSIISILVGQSNYMPGTIFDFLGTFFLYDVHYNGAWWYMWAYVLLVLISPLLLKATDRFHFGIILVSGFVLYCGAYYVRFNLQTDDYFLVRFGPFGMTVFEYLIGCVFCKLKLFTRLDYIRKKIPAFLRWSGACVLIIAILLGHTLLIQSLFVAPFTGLIIIILFSLWNKPKLIETLFLFIGKHSTNIWLTHMFFYLYIFKNFVYTAKYPVAIYFLMIAITILVSMALQFIEKPIMKAFS